MKFHQYLFLFLCFFSGIVVSQNKAESKIITVEDSIAKSLTKGYKLSRNYKYKEGVQIIISAIEFANKLKNDSLVGKGYNALAIINADLGNDTTALKSLRKAKKLLLKAKNYGYLGITYNNMAYVFYENRKDIDSSVYYLKKAVTAHKNSKNTWSLALTYYNLGEMLEKKNELDKSLNVLDSALYYSKKVNRIYSLCYTYQAYAEVYYKKKENSKSLNYLNRSLKIAEKEKYNDILVKLYKLKSTLLKEAKNYKSSLENIEKHNQILKILNEKEKLRTLNEISAKFELKEREKELDKVISDNKTKDTRLRNSKIFIFLIAGLLIIAALSTLLLYKNNRLKRRIIIY